MPHVDGQFIRRSALPAFLIVAVLPVAAQVGPSAASALPPIRAEQEIFLSTATIVTAPPGDGRPAWRVSLAADTRTHDGSVETADGTDPTRRNHKFNVAAYELDKLLALDLVPTSVERLVSERPASLTWWVDGFAMNELDRRRKGIAPPDSQRWREQVDAVRVFDELISNTYRNTAPGLYLNSVWDNLLITKDWRVWVIDHTAAFRTRKALDDPDSLTRCPRTVLARMRQLRRAQFDETLGRYLSSEQLEALDARRALLVGHFDQQISRRGEADVLYDAPWSR